MSDKGCVVSVCGPEHGERADRVGNRIHGLARSLIVMLDQLESHQLTVCLAPSKRSDRREWDMIRVKIDENPRWYRKHCGNHPSSRGTRRGKFDTRIKRKDTMRALRGLLDGRYHGKYREDLLRIAKDFSA